MKPHLCDTLEKVDEMDLTDLRLSVIGEPQTMYIAAQM
jgi:hypothetical protein